MNIKLSTAERSIITCPYCSSDTARRKGRCPNCGRETAPAANAKLVK